MDYGHSTIVDHEPAVCVVSRLVFAYLIQVTEWTDYYCEKCTIYTQHSDVM